MKNNYQNNLNFFEIKHDANKNIENLNNKTDNETIDKNAYTFELNQFMEIYNTEEDNGKKNESLQTTSYLKQKRAIRKVEKLKMGLSQEIQRKIVYVYQKMEAGTAFIEKEKVLA